MLHWCHEYIHMPLTVHIVILARHTCLHCFIDALERRTIAMAHQMTSEDQGPLIARASIAVYVVAVFFVTLR